MYQNCCKKCGSVSLHTEVKGNNTGLYCESCGKWQRWLGKDELRAFEYSMREATKEERGSVDKYIQNISKPTGVNFDGTTIIERLQKFIKFLDKEIDKEMTKESLSPEDAIRKNSYCLALERDKNSILNIISGREFNENGE